MVLSDFLPCPASGSPVCTRVNPDGKAAGPAAAATPGTMTAPAMAPTAKRRGSPCMGPSSFGVGCDLHLHHAVGVGDAAAPPFALFELVHRLHAGDDLADHGVLAVEPR